MPKTMPNKQCKTAFILKIFCYLVLSFSYSNACGEETNQGYLNVNGAEIFYQIFGRGSPIIVLHGGPGLNSSYLLPQMQKLASDYKIIFYDQRGTGHSFDTPINEQTINIAQYVNDLNVIKNKLGLHKVALLGHGFGALLAMKYAIDYPHNVAALILVNSLPASHAGFLKYVQEYDRRLASTVPTLNAMQNTPEFRRADPKTMQEYYDMIFTAYFARRNYLKKLDLDFTQQSALNGMKVAAIMQKTYLSTKYNLLPDLKKLRIPVLIIHGREDIVPRKTALETQKAIKGSEVVILNNCGSFAFIEQPDEFWDNVNTFLAEIKPWSKDHY